MSESSQHAERSQRVRELLSGGMAGLTAEDLNLLRQHPELVAGQEEEVREALEAWLRGQGQLRPCSPAWEPNPQGSWAMVRWAWPHFDLVRECWVVSDPHLHLETPDEAEGNHSVYRALSYQQARGFHVRLGPRPVYVTVWPVIDLGWLQVAGAPLHIGPLRAAGAGSRRPGG